MNKVNKEEVKKAFGTFVTMCHVSPYSVGKTLKEMIAEKKYQAQFFGEDKAFNAGLVKFYNTLEENFGEAETKNILGMLGKKSLMDIEQYAMNK